MRVMRIVIAVCLVTAGCTSAHHRQPEAAGTSTSASASASTSASATGSASGSTSATPSASAVSGSAEAPFVATNCRAAEPHPPEPGSVTVGALALPTMPDLTAVYAGGPVAPDADGVTFYKGGIEVRGDHPVVTVTIGAAARSYARIENESYHGPLPHGAIAVTYAGKPRIDAERTWTCWYVGGYNLLDRRTTACLPLDVTVAGDPVVHHVLVPIGVRCQTVPDPARS